MKRIRAESAPSTLDLLLLAAGAALGVVAGYVASGTFGRFTAHRVKRGLKRRRWKRGVLRPGDWTDDAADTLTARVLDVLWAHPVLAQRLQPMNLNPAVEMAASEHSAAKPQSDTLRSAGRGMNGSGISKRTSALDRKSVV